MTSIIADACAEGHRQREEKLRAEQEIELEAAKAAEVQEEAPQPTEETKGGPEVIVIPKKSRASKAIEPDAPEEIQPES